LVVAPAVPLRHHFAMSGIDHTQIERIATQLAKASSALFITGAGVSADSGLPTYRGVGGLYNRDLTDEGIPIEEALSGRMLNVRPEVCWKYIYEVEAACRGAKFNRAHEVIAELESRMERVVVLTQNVDGFHHTAGSTNVIDIHGDVHVLLCTRCDYRERVADYSNIKVPPSCPSCGSLVRPDVVLFGEMLDLAKVARLESEIARGFDIVLSVGTSSLFPYIAAPVVQAKADGAVTIEVNPGATVVSTIVDEHVEAGAAETFAAISAIYDGGNLS
jgi:NAD-dependent deacetylase